MLKKLTAHDAAIPHFTFSISRGKKSSKLSLFDLSSHARAREALAFGLSIKEPEFNIFVIGEDRTGRLQGTLDFIEQSGLGQEGSVDDWIYLYNFENPQCPLPFHLPNGKAEGFSRSLTAFIKSFTLGLIKNLNGESFVKKVKKTSKKLEKDIQEQLEDLRKYALKHNIDIIRNADGTISPAHMIDPDKTKKSPKKKPDRNFEKIWDDVSERLQSISSYAELESEQLVERFEQIKRQEAEKLFKPLFQRYLDKHREISCLQSWLNALENDILSNLNWFVKENEDEEVVDEDALQNRYTVNVFVKGSKHQAPLIVEPNPTYENVFGRILYKNTPNGYTTNFSMMSAGSLHQANGGILILRADALAFNPETWKYLKDALRDREIRIEELHRANSLPILDSPKPRPIPLNVKIILIGSPMWFYNYLYLDSDFGTYFKIKADINSNFDATRRNIETMALLLQEHTAFRLGMSCSKEAISFVIGYSARLLNDQ